MESSLVKRRKITLLFLLGVGLPSLVLSYLAFRGIRNELALTEQRRLDEHRALSRLLSDTIASEIAGAEQALDRALEAHDSVASIDPTRIDPILHVPVRESFGCRFLVALELFENTA